jgi:hypothetical protein
MAPLSAIREWDSSAHTVMAILPKLVTRFTDFVFRQ